MRHWRKLMRNSLLEPEPFKMSGHCWALYCKIVADNRIRCVCIITKLQHCSSLDGCSCAETFQLMESHRVCHFTLTYNSSQVCVTCFRLETLQIATLKITKVHIAGLSPAARWWKPQLYLAHEAGRSGDQHVFSCIVFWDVHHDVCSLSIIPHDLHRHDKKKMSKIK